MFDVHENMWDEHGEYDEQKWERYREGLLTEFARSPEAAKIVEQGMNLGWTALCLDYAFDYLGLSPLDIKLVDQNEILFDIIPRKVIMEPVDAGKLIAEVRAFWLFLVRQYGIVSAQKLAVALDDRAVDRLTKELGDSSNFSMSKSLATMAKAQGYDITNPVELQLFSLAYNTALSEEQRAPKQLEVHRISQAGAVHLGWWNPPIDRKSKRKKSKAQRQAKKRNRR